MQFIATKTTTIHLPSGRPIKLVKGADVSPATRRKLIELKRAGDVAPKPSQVARRIPNRRAQLDRLNIAFDVNLIVMEEIVSAVPDEVIRGWKRQQINRIRSVERPIIAKFGLDEKMVSIPDMVDDYLDGTEARMWMAWPVEAHLEPAVREMARELIKELWGY